MAALLAATPFAASAADIPMNYTYVEAGYSHLRFDDGEPDTLGGGYVRGSFAIAEQVYVFGGYSQVARTERYEDFFQDVDGTSYDLKLKVTYSQPEIGIGYHMPFTDRLDFTADLAWQRLEFKAKASIAGESDSDKDHLNIGRINLGVRGKPSARTELWLKAGYVDGSDVEYLYDSQFVGTLGGQIGFTRTLGLVGEVQFFDGSRQGMLGLRASF